MLQTPQVITSPVGVEHDRAVVCDFSDLLLTVKERFGARFAGIATLADRQQWCAVASDRDALPAPAVPQSEAVWQAQGVFDSPDQPAGETSTAVEATCGVCLRGEDGSVAGLLCVVRAGAEALTQAERDILGRLGRLAASHLRLSQAAERLTQVTASEQQKADRLKLLETCLDRLNDIVLITEAEPLDLPGPRILYVNAAFERMTGYTREEIIGESPRKLKGPATDVAESDRIRESLKRWEEVRAEVLNYKKNGETFWNEMTITPVADPTGWFTHWVSIERDVTERRQAAELMAANVKSLADFKAALDESAIVAITDTKGRITYVNDNFCAISKYPREELLGQDHRIINSGFHPPEFFNELWQTIRSGRVWKGQIRNRAKDRSIYWVDTTIVPFLGPDGAPVQYIAIRHDITRQVTLARELEDTNRELSDFAYVVSHDLKAPLRGIGTLAEWLVADYAHLVDDAGRDQFALLTTRVKRLNALIDGILAYSRAGRSRESAVRVDMDALCRNVADMLSPPAHIRIVVENTLPIVLAEPTKAQQLLQNLLSNAIKFSDKPEGLIRVRCDAHEDGWHFQVADNGTGIEDKYFDRIFELFETLAPRDEVEGTGVGLALVKKIVETGGGRVWVESQRGAGSTFHFTWPRCGETTPEAST